jgi:hypothetical protein
VDYILNTGLGSQMANWHVEVTPPLPVGIAITFNLSVNDIKNYYSPGSGIINGTTIVQKNNVTAIAISQSTTPLSSSPRPGCSGDVVETTTTNEVYSLTIANRITPTGSEYDVISGTSVSDLNITGGLIGLNSCETKLEQSILINTTYATINGGPCNDVTNNPESQGILNHSISNTDVLTDFCIYYDYVAVTSPSSDCPGYNDSYYEYTFKVKTLNGVVIPAPITINLEMSGTTSGIGPGTYIDNITIPAGSTGVTINYPDISYIGGAPACPCPCSERTTLTYGPELVGTYNGYNITFC